MEIVLRQCIHSDTKTPSATLSDHLFEQLIFMRRLRTALAATTGVECWCRHSPLTTPRPERLYVIVGQVTVVAWLGAGEGRVVQPSRRQSRRAGKIVKKKKLKKNFLRSKNF
jgi:hypothetical protein